MRSLVLGFRTLALVSTMAIVNEACACPACFGATDSRMAAGMDAGVSFLIGVIAFVLAGVAGTGLFWIHRSRRFPRAIDAPVDTP